MTVNARVVGVCRTPCPSWATAAVDALGLRDATRSGPDPAAVAAEPAAYTVVTNADGTGVVLPAGGGLLVTVGGDWRDGTLHLYVGYLAYVDASKIPTCVNFVDPGTGPFPAFPPEERHPR